MFKSKIFLKAMIIITGIIALFTLFTIFFLLPKVETALETLEEKNAKEALSKVAILTENTLSELKIFKKFSLQKYKDELKHLTESTYSLITYKYNQAKPGDKELNKKLKKEVIDIVKNLRYGDNDYFYISDYNNVLIAHPTLQGKDFSNIKDIWGNLIVPPLVKIARKNGEGFYSYWWKKNKNDDKIYEKLTYAKDFPKWKMVVGTGVYIDDVEKEINKRKERLMSLLKSIIKNTKIGKDGYVFIFNGQGKMLMHPNSNIDGKDFSNIKNPTTNRPIFNDLVDAAKKKSKMLHYKWDRPNDKGNYVYEKISWVKYIPEVDWYIVASAYTDDIKQSASEIKNYIIVFSMFIFITVLIYSSIFFKKLLEPVVILSQLSQKVSGGDYSVRSYIEQDDEIGVLSKSFNNMIETINDHVNNLDKKVKEKTRELEIAKRNIQELLDNAGEGFLFFDSNMKIGKEFSKEVINIFGLNDVAEKDISLLLFKDEKDQKNFRETILDVVNEEDEDIKEVLISLLPNEIILDEKYISLKYKLLSRDFFMLILSDITENKELEEQVKKEQQTLKMIVEIVVSIDQFLELKEGYEKLAYSIDKFKSIDMINSLAREIHTYKGLFAQKEMIHIVKHLHNFENYIKKSRDEKKLEKEVAEITSKQMLEWLNEDIAVIKEVLGDDIFSKKDEIIIDANRIKELSKRINYLYGNCKNRLQGDTLCELETIAKEIEKLNYKNIKILLKPYKKMVEQLAQRLGKEIKPLELDVDNIFIPDRYKPFINTLIHVFRNSVDHGIESPEIRYENGKDEEGFISCRVKKIDNSIVISIKDDGAGIDTKKIKEIAIEKGIFTSEEIEGMSEHEILMIIFKDSLSTNEIVTDISGRGVGLASVLTELKKIGGNIEINNEIGKGVEFKFIIPYG